MKLVLFIWLIFSTAIVYGQNTDDLKRLEEFKRKVNSPVVYAGGRIYKVKVKKDIPYGIKDSYHKLDIYQPVGVGTNKKLPLVIFIHGKTPIETNPKNWGGYISWAELTASKGYVTLNFTQSLAIPGKSIEEAGKDVKSILDYAKANHAKYNIDTNRIALLAYSAGVPLLSTALIHNQLNIKCLGAFYGFMDIRNIDMWKDEGLEIVAKYSLIDYVKSAEGFPPLFIARAGKEHNQGLNETIDSFLLQATGHNINVTLINHPSGVHGFDTQNNDDRSREIIESLFTFLQFQFR